METKSKLYKFIEEENENNILGIHPKRDDGYFMCNPQSVQLDCRMKNCSYNKEGFCNHVSPGITLMDGSGINYFNCWTYDEKH